MVSSTRKLKGNYQLFNFWNWSVEYLAEKFSRYTQQYLEELFYTRGIEET
ncbi:435_t:CDS:2 [Funneliformis geosporum]|nr:435_t:CDS:2 [Funneliformis geosporum]